MSSMQAGRLSFLLLIPYFLGALSLDQKISLKLIESLWQEGRLTQAHEEIDRFLAKYHSADEELNKVKADLLIKKKNYKEALDLLNGLSDSSNFTKERRLLCLYELKLWDTFIQAFADDPSLNSLPFGKKIWDLGLAEAILAEQNLEKKQKLIDQASRLYTQDLLDEFDQTKALSLALIKEDKKEYAQAFKLYERLYTETHNESYQLSMARMASRFDIPKALDLLQTLRWKSGQLGTSAALYAMELLEKKQDFTQLYSLTLEELKLAPEGYRKAKIALYHLKSLYYLKCFDKIAPFYNAYHPHLELKMQDQTLAITLLAKALLITHQPQTLFDFYSKLKSYPQAEITAARILAKYYLEQKNYALAEPLLKELHEKDPKHKEEYLTALGLCYLNTQVYELAEVQFLNALNASSDPHLRKKNLDHLLSLPTLSNESLTFIAQIQSELELKTNTKHLYWVIEGLKLKQQPEKALELLATYGNPQECTTHQLKAELLEPLDPTASLYHFEKALMLSSDETLKAYFHAKLFRAYFERDIDQAVSHLFQAINLYSVAIPDPLFEGLASHLYQKAFKGIKLYLGCPISHQAASQLVRLFSYKKELSTQEKILYAKTLRKLSRYEEALTLLTSATHFHEKLELAKVYNHLGQYQMCDQLLEELLKEKPFTLFLEGQQVQMTKICLHYQRLQAQSDPTISLESLTNQLRVLQVCVENKSSELAFEIELFYKLFLNPSDLTQLRQHPFLNQPTSGPYRKILNFLINHKLDKTAAFSIEEPLSEHTCWILFHMFGENAI